MNALKRYALESRVRDLEQQLADCLQRLGETDAARRSSTHEALRLADELRMIREARNSARRRNGSGSANREPISWEQCGHDTYHLTVFSIHACVHPQSDCRWTAVVTRPHCKGQRAVKRVSNLESAVLAKGVALRIVREFLEDDAADIFDAIERLPTETQ